MTATPAAPAADPKTSSPAPSPAPAPKPAGGSPPSPAPGSSAPVGEKSASEYLSDIKSDMADLDAAGGDAPSHPPAPKRGEDGKFKASETKPGKNETQTPDPETKLADPETNPDEPKPGTMRALGKKYDALKEERDTVLQPKVQSLEAKVAEYERTVAELKARQPDAGPIQERMTAIQKENEALREEIRYVNYRKHPEFTEKYEKPYEEAWAKAVGEITQLNMEMEDGSVRRATPNDFLALANAPLDQLDDLAQKWFPKSAARVIRHVEKMRDLAEQQSVALENAKKGALEFDQKLMAAMQQQNQAFQQAYNGAGTELVKKYPKWFAPDETDPAGNELLKKGFEFTDTVFGGNGNLNPAQKASRLAVIRAKAANHDRIASRLKAQQTRVAELEAKLADYESSEPPTDRGGQPGSSGGDSWEERTASDFRAMDR